MYLNRIVLSNFKNITSTDLLFSSKINCIFGDNGEGKTNLLDAIYYLSMTKSFLLTSDKYIFRTSQSETTLFGDYFNGDVEEKIAMSVKSTEEKVVKRNSKRYSKISEHIGLIPVVIIAPSDTSLICDSSEERRRFMNIILSQTDKEYLRSVQLYNKILIQRNKLLKEEKVSPIIMESLDEQLAREGKIIHKKRGEMIATLADLTSNYYQILSGGKERVSMEYQSDLSKMPFLDMLHRDFEKDSLFGYTTSGVQRDDVLFLLNDTSMRKCSSQGQQKTFLISIKLAQYTLMRELYGFAPILLLDDIFDKLDMKRVEFLIQMVAKEDFGQIFITDSNKTRITSIINSITKECRFFSVTSGEFTLVQEEL